MRFFKLNTLKFYAIAFISVFSIVSANAQIEIASMDTISAVVAQQRRQNFHKGGAFVAVTYDAAKLDKILAKCLENGITDVQFVFATISKDDTTRYFQKHRDVAKNDRQGLIGKPTILLRVPRSAFNLALNDEPKNNELVQRVTKGGPLLISKPYGNIPYSSSYLYFDLGTICPPPNNCD